MSTTQDLINYYAGLLILQYVGKPKAYATIQTLVTPVIMDQLPTQVMNAYNLTGSDVAVGAQLDVLGKYQGVTRSGTGLAGDHITLTDADFLQLIRMAIIRNTSGSSLQDIQALLHQFFPDQILVFDYANMQMSYLVSSTLGSIDLIQLFITEGLLPKPMGVGLASVIYVPVITEFFGFRTYLLPGFDNNPFNDYGSYQTDWPWLSYSDAVNSPNSILTTQDGDELTTQDGTVIITQ